MSRSPISVALALHQEHIDAWMPVVGSYHPYWTRAEKKRVFEGILQRDTVFVQHFLEIAAASEDQLERVNAAVILFTYLSKAQFLFQYTRFRRTIWNKMNELEMHTHEMLEGINSTESWVEYDEQATLRNYLYELLHAIWILRGVLRGTNDETFYQG